MRKIYLLSTLVLMLLVCGAVNAQDFSNKGREFWLVFPAHLPSGTSLANMALFITSDKNSSGRITVNGYAVPFAVTANQIAGPYNIPYNRAYVSEVGTIVNKGIQVKVNDGQPPVVVFAHIYAGFRSEASLILPVSTLGKKYYSTNFWQASTGGSRSQFQVVATAPNTVIQYQLRRNGILNPTVNTATLPNPGDVLQIQDDQDLTGSLIESIATADATCNKIAVFSGSSSLSISRPGCTGNSFDPLYQQCYPVNAWGKNFGVIPLANNGSGFHVRVTASEDNTVVNFNGTNVVLNAGQFYPAAAAAPTPFTTALTISADKPISVAQYLLSAACSGSASFPGATQAQGDPDMIILNPVEQSISDINIFSSNLENIRTKYLCVYMKSDKTSTFRINGALPNASFTPMPSGNGYSYLVENLTTYTTQSFRLTADDGFNAITYGMGDAESYGYSAGTNVKDLYQYVAVDNDYATGSAPAACKGAPFQLSVTFPYQPTQITWQFNGLFADVVENSPVFNATSVVDGRTLYTYELANPFTSNIPGVYPIKVVAQTPTTDGCGGVQEIEYELEIVDPPQADFNFTTNGCVSTPVSFTDNSSNVGTSTIGHWYWSFGDGNVQQDVASVNHNYTGAGTYNVKYTIVTESGCKADTVTKAVVLTEPPVASFTIAAPYCAGKAVTFRDASSAAAGGTLVKWIWDFGDGSAPVTASSNADQVHTYAATGTYTVTLQVETAGGCLSTVRNESVTIRPNPVVDFNLPNVCLPAGTATFNSSSTISDGTESLFTYVWNFGDGSGPGATSSPVHIYATGGPFTVQLTVTSNNGCVASATKSLTTVYPEPVADFTAPAEICLGTAASFTDQSTAAGSTITQWQWNFGDGSPAVNTQSPAHTYTAAGTYSVTLSAVSAAGCPTVNTTRTKTIIVNPLPTVNYSPSLPGCAGRAVTFTDGSVANAGSIIKWTWNFGDGNTVAQSVGNTTHNYSNVNTYTVTLQVETDKGCIAGPSSQNVSVSAVPVADFTPPVICVNDVVPMMESSSISSGSVTAWEWDFGDANATPGNPNTSAQQNPAHHYTVAGTYTARLIAISNAGCRDTILKSFDVNGGGLTSVFSVENTGPLCSNGAVTIKDASQIDAGRIIRVEIFWDAVNDPANKTTDNSPAFGKTYTHTYPEFGSPASKDYTIRYDIYSGVACVQSITRTITLLATPSLAFAAVNPVCENDPAFQLSQAHLQNVLPGTGVFTGTGVSSAGVFDPVIGGEGVHLVTYTYTADNGCVNALQQSVEVNPTPIADAGPDKFVLEGGTVMLTPVTITNMPVSYLWDPAAWLDNPAIANPKASPPTDFIYTLTVTSDKGCHTSDDVFVSLLKAPVIPNAFTPNGDGIHDRWEIKYLESYPGCVIEVFNRYGQVVYKTVNYPTPWDGRVNGKDLPTGTYYYVIDPKNGRKPMTGSLTIIR